MVIAKYAGQEGREGPDNTANFWREKTATKPRTKSQLPARPGTLSLSHMSYLNQVLKLGLNLLKREPLMQLYARVGGCHANSRAPAMGCCSIPPPHSTQVFWVLLLVKHKRTGALSTYLDIKFCILPSISFLLVPAQTHFRFRWQFLVLQAPQIKHFHCIFELSLVQNSAHND